MIKEKKLRVLILLGAFFLIVFFLESNFAQQVETESPSLSAQSEKAPEKIISSPKDIKEKTAIYVFVVWMWVAIIVLLFVVRLKIKESDRLYELRFLSKEEK